MIISVSQQANALVNSLIGENRISTLGLVVVDEVSESKICSIILLSRGGGGTPLQGLNGDVRPARVCFSGFLS